MIENQNKQGPKSLKTLGLIILGMGLILIGVAAFKIWLPSVIANREQSGADDSVIPANVKFKAPELALTDLAGKQAELKDYQGQVVLVNNWATWCPPCKEEMPALQEFYSLHKDQGFVLIAVEAGESSEEVAQFVKDYGLTFPVWVDGENQSLRAFRNYTLPNSYVIDREGFVRLAWTGGISIENLEKYITPLLED
jgi:thiol-disulfide isomerase/thioredoxin